MRKQKTKPKSPAAAAEPGTSEGGTRLFEIPYTAPAPRMIKPEIGLRNLVARAGHNAGYIIDVTLLDAPDHRLIRSGVLLAHRVIDGSGEWYLGAPDWTPELPEECIQPMGHADMPEDFLDLIRPFRRTATLGPVAGLTCERREFAFRDDHGVTLALLRDDRVTVRRGGLTTARFREVMLTPVGPGLTGEQLQWLQEVLVSSGGTAVTQFPRLVARLGAPATGPTDFPVPHEVDADAPFEAFVSQLLSSRLRGIVSADLAVRTGDLGSLRRLAEHTDLLRRELEGLSSVLAPDWTEDLDEELEWVTQVAGTTEVRLPFQGERYLTLLERLVNAARGPRLGDSSGLPTIEVIGALVETALARLRKSGAKLAKDDATEQWEQVEQACAEASHVLRVASWVTPGEAAELNRQVAKAAKLVAEGGRHRARAEAARQGLTELTAEAAFERGRKFEHEQSRHQKAHRRFAKKWDKLSRKFAPR